MNRTQQGRMALTKKAVLYVGYKCNVRCKMCYYRHKKNKNWRTLEQIQKDIRLFADYYKDNCVDITGGEPTVHNDICSIVEYCREKSLEPTIITNGIALSSKDKVIALKNAGIKDFLISVHGIGDVYDGLTDCKKAFLLQEKALNNIVETGIPWRANVVLMKQNVSQVELMAEYMMKYGCRTVNFIVFNPFEEWKEIKSIEFQLKHLDVAAAISKVIGRFENNNMEVNIRYAPLCVMPGYEKNIYGYTQLNYDRNEWDMFSWFRINKEGIKRLYAYGALQGVRFSDDVEEIAKYIFAKSLRRDQYVKPRKCLSCSLNEICDGVKVQYAKQFGYDELKPFDGERIKDPVHFIKDQKKHI